MSYPGLTLKHVGASVQLFVRYTYDVGDILPQSICEVTFDLQKSMKK
jgi:hypothetical protein